jgi:hypothetical protein
MMQRRILVQGEGEIVGMAEQLGMFLLQQKLIMNTEKRDASWSTVMRG